MSMIIYDIIATYFKYKEGYELNSSGICASKASNNYNSQDKYLVEVTNALLDITFALKTSAMFLLLATYNHCIKARMGVPFMSSGEYKTYRIYSVLSFILYFVIQRIFAYDELYKVVAPQFVYDIELIFAAFLLQLTNYRFYKRMNESKMLSGALHGPSVAQTASTVIEMNAQLSRYIFDNNVLTLLVLMDFFGIFAINTDIVSNRLILYFNKFWTDFLTAFFNIAFPLSFVQMILMMFAPTGVGKGSTHATRSYSDKNMNGSNQSKTNEMATPPKNSIIVNAFAASNTTNPFVPNTSLSYAPVTVVTVASSPHSNNGNRTPPPISQ